MYQRPPLSDGDFRQILRALGEHGVLCFPAQQLETEAVVRFGRMFGELEINVANTFHEPGFPEVMVLSNMTQQGRALGLADAGQGWHTDMSYSRAVALASVLYALEVPMRAGKPLGDTQFRNMHLAYETLPEAIKRRLAGRTATHDFAKFWNMMRRRPGSRPSNAPRSLPSRNRSSASTRSPAAPCFTATQATPCTSTAWRTVRAPNS